MNQTIKNIVVPTDFSELSLSAVQVAKMIAGQFHAKIHFLYVIDNEPTLAFRTIDLNSETMLRDSELQAQKILAHLSDEYLNGIQEITTVVRRGNPYKTIIQFAEENGIDLIVMATHGHTGLTHVFLGSVTEKVVRYSQVPVLTVKPHEMQNTNLHNEDVHEHFVLNSN